MYIHQWGRGPRVVLVHGGVLGGRETWRAQRELTERWTLLAPDRPVHLVGTSYGAIVAMYGAVLDPRNVLSLTVIEPPATGVARGVPVVDAFGARVRAALDAVELPPATALREFLAVVGAQVELADPPAPVLIDGMRRLLGARPPDEAELPLSRLRRAAFPMLVVSGGHMDANEIICDTIAERTGAARVVCPGSGHLVPDTGKQFNDLLERFLVAANRSPSA